MDTPTHSIEDLLTHAEWVRGLAGRLIRDADQAEDVVQATWLAAVERPVSVRRDPRGWLAAIVRNKARMLARTRDRREQRERDASRPEAQPSAAALVERASLQRELATHVLELDEPYRTAVLLRYFEDMAPPQIAEHLGVPLKTVHSRLARAASKLRERLDSEHGGRGPWIALLVPLRPRMPQPETDAAPRSTGEVPLAIAGGWIVNTQGKLAILAGTLLLGAFAVRAWKAAPPAPAEPSIGIPSTALRPLFESKAPAALDPGARRMPAGAPALAESAEAVQAELAPAATQVAGRVVDVQGRPVPNVAVVSLARPNRSLAVSGADGSFLVELDPEPLFRLQEPAPEFVLRVAEQRWTTLRESYVRASNRSMAHLVVAARAERLECVVVDAAGRAVEGATVEYWGQGRAFQDFPESLDLTSLVRRKAVANSAGRCAFENFPRVPGIVLTASAPGFESASLELDEAPLPYLFELVPLSDVDGDFFEGTVFDEHGLPVEGARVQLADWKAISDFAGRFRLTYGWVPNDAALCASTSGRLPALIPGFGAILNAKGKHLEPVELTLAGAPLEIHGRVIDDQGEPCAFWTLQVLDESAISQGQIPVQTAESLARTSSKKVLTDKQGRFILNGLYPRAYRVRVFESRSLVRWDAVLDAGARDVIVRVALPEHRPLFGRVVDRTGNPIDKVRVRLAMRTFETSFGSQSAEGDEQLTAEDGAFAFERVPVRDVYVGVSGEGILPGSHELRENWSEEKQEVVVSLRRHFRVELNDPGQGVDRIEMRGADDRRLQINRFEAHGMSASMQAAVVDGRTETLSVSDEAVTLVLLANEEELFRRPITLTGDKVTVLRP